MKTQNKNILLIDDNDIDNFVNKAVIDKSNRFEKIIVHTYAEEALEELRKNANDAALLPGIILLDIRMPVMDGFEFLEEFSKFQNQLAVQPKIYMLSSSFDPKDIIKAKENKNVIRFISKPLKVKDLEEVITELEIS